MLSARKIPEPIRRRVFERPDALFVLPLVAIGAEHGN
jgi:hypothetical protein